MDLKLSARLASAVCAAQVVVVRAPATAGAVTCGGEPMLALGEAGGVAAKLGEPQEDHAVVGKRYVDDDSGLELLCTKGGDGAFGFDGRPLRLKEAKALPASD